MLVKTNNILLENGKPYTGIAYIAYNGEGTSNWFTTKEAAVEADKSDEMCRITSEMFVNGVLNW